MLTFEKIKRFYDYGLWTTEQVREAVVCNKITEQEYQSITNEPY